MIDKKTTLDIILEEWPKNSPNLSKEIIERIFKAEERIQFDGNRGDISSKIKEFVQVEIETSILRGKNNETH